MLVIKLFGSGLHKLCCKRTRSTPVRINMIRMHMVDDLDYNMLSRLWA